jgi:hypothetical protein
MPTKSRPPLRKAVGPKQDARTYRNSPKLSIESTFILFQKIQDEMGGKPMNRHAVSRGARLISE